MKGIQFWGIWTILCVFAGSASTLFVMTQVGSKTVNAYCEVKEAKENPIEYIQDYFGDKEDE